MASAAPWRVPCTKPVINLTAVGRFIQFANQLEGLWDYDEVWTDVTSEQGTISIAGQVGGTVVGTTAD